MRTRTVRGLTPALAVMACAGVLALAAAGPAAAAAPVPELDAALQKVREDTGVPAAAASVVRCGRVVWSGASGETVLGSGQPVTLDSRFVIGSTTKPATAALVLWLTEQGKLTLKDPLSRFYPKLPGAPRITVQMLLDHTSGLSEYFDDPRIMKVITDEPTHRWTRAEVLRGITKLKFTPGSRYEYSNSNYVVLGGIVEKLTKRPVEQVFRSRIAGPLRLTRTTFEYRPEQSNLFAHPYVGVKGNFHDVFVPGVGISADYWGPVWTDGGLASTAPELARMGDGLFEGKIVQAKSLKTMTRLNRFGHGLGLDPLKFAGRTWFGHSGGYFGYGSEVWSDAKRRVTIAVTTTNTEASAAATWQQIVTAFDRVAPTSPACPAPAGS
jgi:D-alanyl-D-alanine carboxypeptidase